MASEREKTHTVFTVFNYKKPAAENVATVSDTFPLALASKDNGSVEMLTATGGVVFDGTSASATLTYPEPTPWLYCQSDGGTLISYRTMTGTVLVQGLSERGDVSFTKEYSTLLSLGCTKDYFFILTETNLFVLDGGGTVVLEQPNAGYSKILVSPEVSVLLRADAVTRLDLSSLP